MSSNEKESSGQFKQRLNKQTNKQTNKPLTYLEGVKKLTPAEIDVLDRVEKGYTNKEIASGLGLSIRTIHTHRNNICRKLGIQGRGGLLKWLLQVRNKKNR